MRGMCSVLAAAMVAMTAGCEERVRECGGGVEVVLSLDDVATLDVASDALRVTLDVDGVLYDREFHSSALSGGVTSFTVDLENTAPVTVVVTVESVYAGPGPSSGTVPWLHGEGTVVVPAGNRGCAAVEVGLLPAPDRDGDHVPDAIDGCPDDADRSQLDGDGDMVNDVCDGCPAIADPDQTDRDSDGTPDACDACPAVANQSPDDEDGDAVPDACDPCPHLSGDRTDGDGDGVGDACDPRPSVGGDRIVAFLNFMNPAQMQELFPQGQGTASIENGQLVIFSNTNMAMVIPRVLSLSGAVWTRVHQLPLTTEFPWGAGVIAWADPSLTTSPDAVGTVCLSHSNRAYASEWPTIGLPVQPTQHDPDVVVSFSFIDEGSTDPLVALGVCQTDVLSTNHSRSWSGETILPGFGVMVVDAVARFDYVLVIDSP